MAYTTANVSNANVTVTHVYDSTIKDRLKSFNGSSISYDSNGYPTYYNNKNYIWTKDKLTRIFRGNGSQYGSLYEYCNFAYDGYGRRTSKSYSYDPNPGSTSDYSYMYTTTYDYDTSGRLIHETCIEVTTYTGGSSSKRDITYLYDESGIVGAIQKLGSTEETFYFDKNIKGDVIALYNSSGTKVASYIYDAWGNCTTKTLVSNNFSTYNPIRYRGYYYDRETGLYYLNVRYYNPEWRRFISPDDTAYLDPETPNGLNLYAYCNNDSVNYSDPSGHSITLALIFAGTFAVGFGSSLFINAATNNWELDWRDFAQAGVDGLFAVAGTALAMTGICGGLSIGLGAVMGLSQYAIGTKIQGGNLTLCGSLTAIAFGALGGKISGPGATNVQNVADNLIGLSDDGLRAAKAIVTAMNRRMAGQISKRGFQGVLNLYGKTAFSAIDDAITITSVKLFKESARNLSIYTPFANIVSGLLNYLYNLWGCI